LAILFSLTHFFDAMTIIVISEGLLWDRGFSNTSFGFSRSRANSLFMAERGIETHGAATSIVKTYTRNHSAIHLWFHRL
jgi:hypothetical protein